MVFNFSVDYLSFTWKPTIMDDSTRPFVSQMFLKLFPELDKAFSDPDAFVYQYYRSHYSMDYRYKDSILYSYDTMNTRFNKGVFVSIPSSGIQDFLQIMHCKTVIDVLKLLYDRHCSISRIDLALDDFTKSFDATWYRDKRFKHDSEDNPKGYISTPCRAENIAYFGSKKKGATLYVGDIEHRRKFLRIYDKFIESNGQIDSIRYEFELHGQYAQQVSLALIDGTFVFSQYLHDWISVKDHLISEENMSRLPDDPEWAEWFKQLEFSEEDDKLHLLPAFKRLKPDTKRRLQYVFGREGWIVKDLYALNKYLGTDLLCRYLQHLAPDIDIKDEEYFKAISDDPQEFLFSLDGFLISNY